MIATPSGPAALSLDESFGLIVDLAPIALAILGPGNELARCNRPFAALAGRDEASLRARTLLDLLPPGERAGVAARAGEIRAGARELHTLEASWPRPDGTARWVRLTIGALRGPDRAIIHMTALAEDISERKEAELALRASEERWQALVHNAPDIIAIVEPGGTRRYASPALQRTLGYPPETALPANFSAVHPDDVPVILRQLRACIAAPDGQAQVEYRMRARDGSWHHFEATFTDQLAHPSIGGIVVNARDVTARKAVEAQVAHWALHDPLTGLANRVLFMDRVEHALDRARRGGQLVAILVLDLDRFKLINESLGHQLGDDLLDSVAARLRRCVRDADTVARLGGDLFTILLEAPADTAEVLATAARLGTAIAQPFRVGERVVTISVSIGIALAQRGARDAGDLLREADSALGRAKAHGGGGCEVYDPALAAPALQRLELEGELRRALDTDALHLRYQPVRNLATGAIDRVEALARWDHPRRGPIPPDQFIPLAEESGLIHALGRWVLRAACAQAQAWRRQLGPDAPVVAVNLSAREFEHPELVGEVAAALAAADLPPAALQLEITETIAMRDVPGSIATLGRLRDLGVGLALDDFGTGFSSLGQLHHLPVDTLKIDRSFLSDHATPGARARGQAILAAVTALGHALGLRVTAEGIESAADLALVRAAGSDHGQGYHLARPLPAADITALLTARTSATAGDLSARASR